MAESVWVQSGSVLITLILTLIGIFRGLIPKLLESFERRLADKDTALSHQREALEAVCEERRELTQKFVAALEEIVLKNAQSMTSLKEAIEGFGRKISDEHALLQESHREIAGLLKDLKGPKARRAAVRAAGK